MSKLFESGELRQTILLVLGLSVMMFSRILLDDLMYFIVSTITIILIIALVILQQYIFQIELSKYPCLKLLTYPERRYLQLFIKQMNSVKVENNEYIEVILGKPVTHKEFGKIKKVFLEVHNSTFDDHIEFSSSYVTYQGYVIEHPAVDVGIGYEISGVIDHGQPYPVYLLLLGGKDFPKITKSKDIYELVSLLNYVLKR
jgi:hypothetical protein